jgi:hypothetical protein
VLKLLTAVKLRHNRSIPGEKTCQLGAPAVKPFITVCPLLVEPAIVLAEDRLPTLDYQRK